MSKNILSKLFSKKTQQIYCSVDLEFTGFDPAKDQILEIGFAFFTLAEDGVTVTEQWSQVFKPSMEVHPKILGLTGITQEELDSAPEFSKHRDFLQKKLGSAIIVGHNPVMDVKFLESYGIKLSGQTIDTLELVQFLLPTHHSYNLENLVHFFGVKHSIAHRALGDALSTIAVLENLVKIYNQFTDELKSELEKVFSRGEFLWKDLLQLKLNSSETTSNDSLHHLKTEQTLSQLKLASQLVVIDSEKIDHEARVAFNLKNEDTPSVMAVSDSAIVMRLWKDGLVHGVFRRDDTFSKPAFEKFMQNAETNEQLRFCLKILVWLHTNWQNEVVFDLNISFFGGQFKQFIVGGETVFQNEKVLCVDYATLETISTPELPQNAANRKLVICDIQNFEKYISTGFGTRLSWNSMIYSLRLIYNPETDFGNLAAKEVVLNALAGVDLFFSLTFLKLQKAFPSAQYVSITDLKVSNEHVYVALQKAALNLVEKVEKVLEVEPSPDLNRIVKFLTSYFLDTEGRVKWVLLDEDNLSFHDQPLDIAKDAQKIITSYQSVQLTDTLFQPELLSYYVDRLGLYTELAEIPKKTSFNQFNFDFISSCLKNDELLNMSLEANLPLVIVFSDQASVKSFYNESYLKLKEKAALFAQGYSGGGNKMFRNFSIREESILLVTAEFIAKQNYLIPAKTIVFTVQPKVETSHPYITALLLRWKESFPTLEFLLSMAKVVHALKKINTKEIVSVKLFGFDNQTNEKNFFVDKLD